MRTIDNRNDDWCAVCYGEFTMDNRKYVRRTLIENVLVRDFVHKGCKGK